MDLFSYNFSELAKEHLCTALNDSSAKFKQDQLESILNIVEDRKKLLLVQKTGWGKSMVYFIATKILRDEQYHQTYLNNPHFKPGPVIMISPLLSLMRNQVMYGNNLIKIERLDSSLSNAEKDTALNKFVNNEIDLLIISPERLSNEKFFAEGLSKMAPRIPLLIIDEAHCVSDWGHDFRPDYMKIKSLVDNLPEQTPIIATTATANERVVNDIVDQFGANTKIFRGELLRNTIQLESYALFSEAERLAFMKKHIPNFSKSGIVYTLTTRTASRVALWLKHNGINAHAYHRNIDNDLKEQLENDLLSNSIDVLVATSALGMGFDKPDLGFVIHYQCPQSVVHYYQQVGRAGRGIDEAFGICLMGSEDEEINNYFINDAYPREDELKSIINVLDNSSEPLTVGQIEFRVNIRNKQIEKCLKILNSMASSPVIKKDNKWQRSVNSLKVDWNKVNEIKEIRQNEWIDMQAYVQSEECLMNFLSKSLGDDSMQNCRKCSSCRKRKHFDLPEDNLIVEANQFIGRLNIPISSRKRWMKPDFDSWPSFKGNIPTDCQNEEGRALCHFTDSVFGKHISDGKKTGQFSQLLVKSSAELIADSIKWPKEEIDGIAYIPSNTGRDQVARLAEDISEIINIPVIHCLTKIRINKPQKLMENTAHRKKNLDGIFEVKPIDKKFKNLILIDDIVDSGWTLTVAGALLKDAGIDKVYPFVLAYQLENIEEIYH